MCALLTSHSKVLSMCAKHLLCAGQALSKCRCPNCLGVSCAITFRFISRKRVATRHSLRVARHGAPSFAVLGAREEASGAFVATQLWHTHTKPQLHLAGVERAGRCHLTSRVYICCRLFLLGIGALNSVVTNQNAESVQTKRYMQNDTSRSRHMPAHCVSSWQWHCTTAPFRCGQRPFWTKAQYPAAKGRCYPPCTTSYN